MVLHVTQGTLADLHYLDEVLHQHVLPIYPTAWNDFLFQ